VLNHEEDIMPTPVEIADRDQRAVARANEYGWGLPMVMGILLIVGGMFALSATVLTSVVSVIYLGVLLLIVGVFEIIAAFRRRHSEPFVVYFLAGLLSLVVGGLFLYRPLASLAPLTLLIAGYFFASGLFRGITSIVDRYPRWGWDLAYSIVALALGVYVAASWPISSLWVLGTVMAVEIIARGITLVAASWVLRDIRQGRIPGGLAAA
jgi:uncharacterized membrane protein HdeD (DUF308 family)